ncbi:MAG: right-handed parallel beta-helix repeat-containing protein [Kiritimatiellae bacterium]|nr:right-handed parallel beta-helix repeat-containing protein [Kiritimatiellia bacterium]
MRIRHTLCIGLCLIGAGLPAAPVHLRQAEPPAFEPARTLYVAPHGADTNDGLSPETPFRTIGKAAKVTEPGDLVRVAGGTYFEHVHLKRPGTAEKPIVFRAAPGETAVVTFGDRPEQWEKTAGRRFTYATPYAYWANTVWEDRTVTRYVEVNDPVSLDESPGSFVYDKERRMLYVHPLRGSTPLEAGVVVVAYSDSNRDPSSEGGQRAGPNKRNPYDSDKGFWFRAPYNRVEGFVIAYQPIGIQLRIDNVEAWNNTIYGCTAGVHSYSGKGGVIAGNVCFRNDSHGIIVGASTVGITVRDNLCYDNCPAGPFRYLSGGFGNPHNIALYGGATDVTFVRNTAISDRRDRVWRYKSARGRVETTHNVLVGGTGRVTPQKACDYSYNTVIGGELRAYNGGTLMTTDELAARGGRADGPLYLKAGARADDGFADPARYDYRLRADSPHLGKGAWPEAAPLRYVAPDGDDTRDGRTPKTAWRTIQKAAGSAGAGETVFILPGTYPETVTLSCRGTREKPIVFVSHGYRRVVIDGEGRRAFGLVLKDAAHVRVEGLIVRNVTQVGIGAQNNRDVELARNVVDQARIGIAVVSGVDVTIANTTVLRCQTGVELGRVQGRVTLRNNLLAEIGGEPIAMAGQPAPRSSGLMEGERRARRSNEPGEAKAGLASRDPRVPDGGRASRDPDPRVADGGRASREPAPRLVSERNAVTGPGAQAWLAAWRERVREPHASLAADVALTGDDYALPVGATLAFAGLGHRPIGARHAERDRSPVAVEAFRVAGIRPDQATLTWRTPFDYPDARLAWKGPDGKERKMSVSQTDMLKLSALSARLADLAPGTAYAVTLEVDAPDGRKGGAELSFRTPTAVRAPATLHVAPAGDDGNDGLGAQRPFRTLAAASFAAVPGDTILVAPGVYPETLTLWSGGLSEQRPLLVRSTEPGGAVIDCGGVRDGAIRISGLQHVTVDGFRIRGLWYTSGLNAVQINKAQDVRFVNNVIEAPDRSRCTCRLLYAAGTKGLLVRNNVFEAGFYGLMALGSDEITIEHNTFHNGGVTGVLIDTRKDARLRIANNIFSDVISENKANAAVNVYRPSNQLVLDHNLYWRKQCPKMHLFHVHETEAGEKLSWGKGNDVMTVEELQRKYGLGLHSRFADPQFVDPAKHDFRLKPGSPAIGMGENGATVGAALPGIGRAGETGHAVAF